ncbi:hypothetical protein [Microcystis aeruginosa]|nr:hypothetical protein [Microcystis aeruginosa]
MRFGNHRPFHGGEDVKSRLKVFLVRVCGKKFFLGAGCGVWGVRVLGC